MLAVSNLALCFPTIIGSLLPTKFGCKLPTLTLTPREAARLQTFPDNYFFESTKEEPGRTAAFRQIGNAVPVRLAYSVANALRHQVANAQEREMLQ